MRVTGGPGTVLAGVLLAVSPCAFALNPNLDVSQYAHKPWTIRDGFTRGAINSVVQTADGYLWLGTEFGLLRFDGVKNAAWQPPTDQQLPSSNISRLFVAADGTLWIGTSEGLASWKDGKLTLYKELAGQVITAVLQDYQGSIWAGGIGIPTGRLCAIQKGSVRCYGEDGSFGFGVQSLSQYKGGLWVGSAKGLLRWMPGPPKFYSNPDPVNAASALIEGDNGRLWMAMRSGIRQFVDGKFAPYPLPVDGKFDPRVLLRDREGGLWIGTSDQGLVHMHQGRTDVFTSADGLSGDDIASLFEDREGNIWVGTREGLDRFRDFVVSTISSKQGLSTDSVFSVLAARDGSVWLGSSDGVNVLNDGQVTVYRGSPGRSLASSAHDRTVHQVGDKGLPDDSLGSLFQDESVRIWVSTLHGMARFEDGRFIRVSSVPRQIVRSMAEEGEENLWIDDQDQGLIHLLSESETERIPWATLGHKDFASALVSDRLRGGLWLGFYHGGLTHFKDAQIRASYKAEDGLGAGRVNGLRLDRDGTLWAATVGGLSRLKNGRIATLTSKSGLPCDAVHWMTEDDAHSVWLYMPCGLARIARSDLDAWAADPNHIVKATVFDSSDGVRSRPGADSGFSPQVSKSPDGKLWFVSPDGLSVIDPRHLPTNKLPPPIQIEAVKVNGKEQAAAEAMELSHSSNDLEIDYTALSFTIPERVRFRYKLEGKDRDWQDVGTRRQAYYGGLTPKQYRFRVIASNNDGVWNEAGATWNFSIRPAYYQTTWFLALCVAAGAGMLWLLYRLRLLQITARVNLLYHERMAERTRIARDLHDTLLQSLAGVSLQLDGIAKQAAKAPEKVPSLIARVREQVDSAFREARVKVWNLRSTTLGAEGLEKALRQMVERIAQATKARCEVVVSGQPRQCSPEVEEELLRIAQEAANNASLHAQANQIRIALDYKASSLTLTIADDGRGFDFKEGYGKSGHWGLKNMQERAAQVRGTCKITTAVGEGTKIEVSVPLSSWSLRNPLAKNAHSSSSS